MSKKDKLKAQSQKQDILRKELEEEERLAKEEARYKQSKSAKKMMKKAKYGRYGKEPVIMILLRILMIFPFLYSGFFYGGVLILGIAFERIEPLPPKWVFWFTLSGTLLIFAGIIIDFFKKHIISFITICAGTFLYLKSTQYLIDRIQQRLDEVYVEKDLQNMDKVYMQRHYPILGVTAISFIILIIAIICLIKTRRKAQHAKDTAPVKSIIE